MFVIQDQPKQFQTVTGVKVQAIATLKDNGCTIHLAADDQSYVLFVETSNDMCRMIYHWPAEVVAILPSVTLSDGTQVGWDEPKSTVKCTAQVKFTPAAEIITESDNPTEPKIETTVDLYYRPESPTGRKD